MAHFTVEKGDGSRRLRVPVFAIFVALTTAITVLSFANRAKAGQCDDPTNPCTISTPTDLQNINNDLTGYYQLDNDITLSGPFTPIGQGSPFTGVFNGQNYTISGLTINSSSALVGLFDYIQSAKVENLDLSGVSVQTTNDFSAAAGAVAGVNDLGLITNVHVTGQISNLGAAPGIGSGVAIGGIVGNNSGQITQSSTAVNVSGAANTNIGGLVGANFSGSGIQQSFSTGTVNGGANSMVGGLLGWNLDSTVSQSYSLASVSGTGTNSIGGLVGMNGGGCAPCTAATIDQTYSVGPVVDSRAQHLGNLVGQNEPLGISVGCCDLTWNQGVVTNSYTAIQLQPGLLPPGFDSTVWAPTLGQYPTLISNPTPSSSCSSDLTGAVQVFTTNNDTGMNAIFAPSVGLAQAEQDCKVASFDWQQEITNWPSPSLFASQNAPNTFLTAPPAFNDPVPGGYTYNITCANGSISSAYRTAAPFYYDPAGPSTDCFSVKANTLGDAELAFGDRPADGLLLPLNLLGANDYMAFATQLVGIRPDGTIVPDLFAWTWQDTYDGLSGGVVVTASSDAVDPGGYGGITVLTIDGQPIPEPPTVLILVSTLLIFGLYRSFAARAGVLSR